MTPDQVIQMLHKAIAENTNFTTWTVSTPHLVALVNHAIEAERAEFAVHAVDIARRAVAEEREACAKLCEEPWQGSPRGIAEQIRARGQE